MSSLTILLTDAIFIVILVALTALIWIRATYWKPGMLFGVPVAADALATAEGKRIERGWRTVLTLTGMTLITAETVAALIGTLDLFLGLAIAAPLLFTLMLIVMVVRGYRQAQGIAVPPREPLREASLRAQPAVRLHWWWEILPVGIIGGTAAWLAQTYANAPVIIPTHFGIDGKPNAFASKSIGSYFLILWFQIAFYLLFSAIGWFTTAIGNQTAGQKRSLNMYVGPEFFFILKVAIISQMAAMQLLINGGQTSPVGFSIITLVMLAVVFGAVFVALSRYNRDLAANRIAQDQTPDRYWIGGVIYRNPTDPSLFVERRLGLGYTVNFGHPFAWVLVAGFALFIAGTIILSLVLTRP